MMRLLLVLLVASILGMAARPSSVPVAVAPSAARISDPEIDRALRAKLSKSKLAANKFQFQVQGGVVTIDGRTNVIQHKGIMTRMAKSAGARAVNNRIEISEAARAKAKARLEKARVVQQPALQRR